MLLLRIPRSKQFPLQEVPKQVHILQVLLHLCLQKLSLELGGKNPNIIFADCDYDKMLATTVRLRFQTRGQICLCGSRILVEEKIYDKFKKDFIQKVAQLKVGNPSEEVHKNWSLSFFRPSRKSERLY